MDRASCGRRGGPIGPGAAAAVTRALLVAIAVLAGVRMVAAQDVAVGQDKDKDQENTEPLTNEAERPPVTGTTAVKRLDLGLSFYDAFDLTSISDVRGVLSQDPISDTHTQFAGGNASLTYTQSGRDNSFSAAAGSDLRYYSAGGTFPADVFGGVNFSTRVSERIRLRGSESVAFSPYYTFGNAPLTGNLSQLIAPQFDQAVNRVDTTTSYTTAGMSWQLDRKSAINAGYNFDYVDAGVASYHVHTMGANGSYQRQLSRYLAIRAGYGFYRSQLYNLVVPYYDSHDIDAGVSYRRPLSFSRRSTIGFNVGSTLVTDGVTKSFYVTGDASFSHQLSQFWVLTASYNRAVSRIGGLAVPFLTDSGSGAVSGRLSKYLTLSGSGSFSRGNTAAVTNNAYDAAYTSGRVTYQLARYLPFYGEYVYYFYSFDEVVGLAPGFPMHVNRHGLRVGLSYAVPLIGRRTT
jgi:hypothetical protein